MEKKINDKELGTITLRQSDRYRRYTLKVVQGEVIATMPRSGNEKRILDFIEEKRQRLKQMLLQYPTRMLLDENTILGTFTFRLQIIREDRNTIRITLLDGILTIGFPSHLDITSQRCQDQLYEIIRNVFRREAKRTLPPRIARLAKQHQFDYSAVKINSSRSHWGSCTGRKSINLSFYLMQLPQHLIDYVLLHELCHTIEMNHSPRFWALMDKVTDGKAKALRNELKQYKML